ncbi:M23 family metallopeptidase [Porphyromonas sp.]|uniref:M23 family metallopeptidase n=1 Tax=Porphyromonas sp. TaxID=1924944 RepID=UPI0026DBECA2|nr:M23 family metallopeptidase [Porphyromonas sp.]MDO4771282.1 M23 family metallopeptidase [Porphyromonas sp.]
MTIKQILLLCSGSCLFSFANATNPPVKTLDVPVKKIEVTVTTTETKKTPTTANEEIKPTNELRADNLNIKDKRRVLELRKAMAEVSVEELENPASDIYGEDSWSEFVNPFAGATSVSIPDTCSIDCTEFSYPLTSVTATTSRFGYRRRFRRMHYGIDLKLQVGDTVRAAFDGKVRVVDFERKGYGNYVVIRHPNGLETVYGHLSKHLVGPDQIVRAGEPIALGGNTGRSTGPHLHFETRFMGIPINPEEIIDFDNGIPLRDAYVFVKAKSFRGLSGTNQLARKKSSGNGSKIVVHKIKQGDTLSTIAAKYGTSVNQICKLNRITTKSLLKIGKSLRIS